MSELALTPDQQIALAEITAACGPGRVHLLTGYAGSGKTTLMQAFAAAARKRSLSIVLTAPTHKAVAVLSRKLQQSGITDVSCRTIHSLLSLKPQVRSDRQIFVREKFAKPVMEDIVVIDECSMISAELMGFIRRYLPESFVLFVGDPAQLPPVGEVASPTFDTPSRSHLDTIVRQAEGNPILAAANTIRVSQGGPMDWSWCASKGAKPMGVFCPNDPEGWMRKAFTSDDFDQDPDTFRYLCWTNHKVATTNEKIRNWRYGPVTTPFVPGERALFRAPVVQLETVVINTNEEAQVVSIKEGQLRFIVPARESLASWIAEIPTWDIEVQRDDNAKFEVQAVRGDREYQAAIARFVDEAAVTGIRWKDRFEFTGALAKMQSIYAMTVHASQGSTFKHCFLDLGDIRRRMDTDLLECQKLFYVAATRPTHSLMLVGGRAP